MNPFKRSKRTRDPEVQWLGQRLQTVAGNSLFCSNMQEAVVSVLLKKGILTEQEINLEYDEIQKRLAQTQALNQLYKSSPD